MNRNDHGFTLIEIVVVLVLISIIAATVFSRSISTGRVNFVGQVDKVRSQIHYAQSLAMKREEIWGIKCSGSQYWLFKYEKFLDDNKPIRLPGEETDKITLSDRGISINGFTLFFKSLGIPYKALNTKVTLTNSLTINISAGSETHKLAITPETGLVVDK